MCSGARPLPSAMFLWSPFTYFPCPTHNRDAPEVSFLLFSRGICGAGGQLETLWWAQQAGVPVPGPRPPCRSRRRSWGRTGAAASSAGWVGPLTPSVFGKGLAQTLCTDGYRVHVSSGRAESWQSEPGGRKWHLAGIYHVFFFSPSLFKNKTSFCSENKKKKKILETCDKLPVRFKIVPVLVSLLNS